MFLLNLTHHLEVLKIRRAHISLSGTQNSSLVRSCTGVALLQGMGDGPKGLLLDTFQGLTDAHFVRRKI
jgi:hypothetical protein